MKLPWLAAVMVLALLSGCGFSPAAPGLPPPAPAATPLSAVSPRSDGAQAAQSARTPEPPPGQWRTILPGLEFRELPITIDQHIDRLRLARIDPQQLRFRVVYQPAQPRRVSGWLDKEGAVLAVNGGYFDPDNHALGLIVHEGIRSGQPYQGFGGMLAINGQRARVRWNVAEPYAPGEPLSSALQNFPMLVLPGGAPNPSIDDNGQLAPRTAVGQDRQGRLVFIVSPGSVFTLTRLGQWLAASDLDLDTALNLDGGSSSGLLVRDGTQLRGVDSWVEVPDAIVVEIP